ncbi:hypothetical protein [Flavobacterium sp.]|uniref:hypothetical protein n=1 Tax=Flavobacterium sp. TaxID=239 RepID=UPI00122531FB|nr:hypothetical protein [Flavobacterium sp.]RZJ71945.1 MAG: hypothetical protein EOO49_07910 [Flavobacterium sp.]
MKKSLFSIGFAVLAMLASCSDKKEKTGNGSKTYLADAAKLHELLTSGDEPLQTFEVPSNKTSEITAKKGTFLRIDPSVFETEDGQPLADKISIGFREITQAPEFVFADIRTSSVNHKNTLAAGVYFLEAKSDGKTLRIKSGKALNIDFRRFSTKRMELFVSNRDSLQNMNWMPSNKSFKRVGNAKVVDDGEQYYMPMQINRLGWIGCNVFNRTSYEFSGPISFDFVSGIPDFAFGKAYLLVEGRDTTMALETDLFFKGKDDMMFTEVPTEGNALFVCTAIKQGKLFAFASKVDLSDSKLPKVKFEQTTAKELFAKIKALK